MIDGKALAGGIEEEVKEGVEELKKAGIEPRLVTVLVGDDPASKLYVSLKKKACERVGIISEDVHLPGDTSQDRLMEIIGELNHREDVHGILVQMPLPKQIDSQTVLSTILPFKDVDGFTPENLGKLAQGDGTGFVPATPLGIIYVLDKMGYEPKGKDAVIIGHTVVVGKPLALMLLARDATVSVCHVHTRDLASYTKRADILVVAAGKKHLIGADHVKEGVVVFDVGITREGKKVYGDVDFHAVKEKASAITPVPGGVGPLTIASLLKNVLKAAQLAGDGK